MKAPVGYLVAVALHAAVLFGIAPRAPQPVPPPEKKYLEVSLATAPADMPVPPAAAATPPPPEPPPPEPPPPPPPEPPPEPPPPPPKVEEPFPEPAPPPPAAPPAPAPVASAPVPATPPPLVPHPQRQAYGPVTSSAPAAPAQGTYIAVTDPSYLERVEPEYPAQARRMHQQGKTTLALYINALGSLDKVEIIKSSGYRLLDEAAAEAMKASRFRPAYQGTTPIPSRAEVTINFVLN
ncbi:MAG TPA: energy transducer TonB [Opitutales bacterium]|nr:energy transducer TonB [Opitutales bacterium]